MAAFSSNIMNEQVVEENYDYSTVDNFDELEVGEAIMNDDEVASS
jgi:hypothetical protein